MRIQGIIPPMATPLKANEDVDIPRLKWFIDHLIEAKVHGKKLTVLARPKRENVVDLMAALKTSLAKESSRKGLLGTAPKADKEQKRARKAG